MTASVHDEDARDLAEARRGNQLAFARIYDRHGAVVLSLCRRRALTDADDATQETFVRAFRMLDRLEDASKLRPWLYGIAKRVCAERRRAARRRSAHEERGAVIADHRRPDATPPGDDAAEREQLDRLGAAIETLDERQRLALHLYYLEADPVRAAMATLGVSRSGYYKLLARAREQLAATLGMGEVKTP